MDHEARGDRRKGCLDERDEPRNETVGKMESEESGVDAYVGAPRRRKRIEA